MTAIGLQLSTSPRETWVWAADDAQAAQLRELLTAAGHLPVDATGAGAQVVNVDIGVVAFDALETLRGAGYLLQWHPSQRAVNRGAPFDVLVSSGP